jgi:predicted outer membrane lipoprotein
MSVRRPVEDRISATQPTHRKRDAVGLVRAALALLLGVLLAAAGAVVAVMAVEMLTDPSGGDRAGVAIVIGLPIFLVVVRVTTSVLLERVAKDDHDDRRPPRARVDAGS